MVELDAGVDHGDIDVDPLVVRSIDGDGGLSGAKTRWIPVGIDCAVTVYA